mgnify:CR=1 FL=1
MTVELKNDLSITGTLNSVDQYAVLCLRWTQLTPSHRFLNIKLDNISVLDEDRHPHMVCSSLPLLRPSTSSSHVRNAGLGAQLLYSRIGGAVRSIAQGGGGHAVVGGCDEEG